MAPRYSAARPKRAGEEFARIHHSEGGSDGKRVRFDVRNPSTLAMEAREEDSVLDADVIGVGTATKRGAVNLDGYDSDSDTETFNAKAAGRKEGKVDIIRQMDHYDARNGESGGGDNKRGDQDAPVDEDEDEDMFAEDADEGARPQTTSHGFDNAGRKEKETRFLDSSQIQGQEDSSKSGGRVRLGEEESSDDEADVELVMEEEGLDEEVGAGGLKRNAPKVEAFNLRQEMEDGRFDQHGNYVRKAEDPDAVHDKGLDGLSKKDLKRAAEAHARREAEAKTQRVQDDEILVSELLKMLISQLEKTETPLEALARLGKKQAKGKKLPKWKLKRQQHKEAGSHADVEMEEGDDDAEQARVKASIDSITDAADKLLSRDYEDIYEQEREMLIRDYRSTTGEEWSESRTEDEPQGASVANDGPPGVDGDGKQWEFRWTDGRDGGSTQGPFDGATMKAWQDAGYFGQGVEFRVAGDGGAWGLAADFS